MKMRLYLFPLVLAAVVLSGFTVCFAQEIKPHPAPDVDGVVWMRSTEQEKISFLFGAGSAIVLEYHLREKHSEQPSKFVKAWVDALKTVSWSEMVARIDAYYKNNPDKSDKNVFAVIWHEMILPNVKN
jgi:hypothetical protein